MTSNNQTCNKNTSFSTHCAFSSNSFNGQITKKAIHQLSDPENKKCSSHYEKTFTNLVSISKNVVFFAFLVVRIYKYLADFVNIF